MGKTMIKTPKQYFEKPTSKKWRKLGDALLAVSTSVSTYAIVDEIKWLAITSVLVGAIGKFLTNFFSEE